MEDIEGPESFTKLTLWTVWLWNIFWKICSLQLWEQEEELTKFNQGLGIRLPEFEDHLLVKINSDPKFVAGSEIFSFMNEIVLSQSRKYFY